MDRKEAYPITYGVLGLLAFCGPMTGYDIKGLFDHALAPMWGAAHSQIYNELRRMKEFGWVEMEREEQEARPDRKVYSITTDGRAALTAWYDQPASFLQLRDELLMRILFGSFAAPEALAENVKASIAQHEMRLLEYRQSTQYILVRRDQQKKAGARNNPYAQDNAPDPFFELITRFAIDFEKTYLRWLYETQAFIEAGQATDESHPDTPEAHGQDA